MPETKEKIIERVRKILRRTTEEAHCTPAEAEAALQKASRLMAEHNLSLAEVNLADSGENAFVSEDCAFFGRRNFESECASNILKRFFFVRPILNIAHDKNGRRLYKLVFFGTSVNVETAKWVYNALLAAFQNLWTAYAAETGAGKGERRMFVCGVWRGFAEKLTQERRHIDKERKQVGKPGTEIVLASASHKLLAAFQEAYPNVHNSAPLSQLSGTKHALDAGYEAGRNLNLSRPIGNHSTKALKGATTS